MPPQRHLSWISAPTAARPWGLLALFVGGERHVYMVQRLPLPEGAGAAALWSRLSPFQRGLKDARCSVGEGASACDCSEHAAGGSCLHAEALAALCRAGRLWKEGEGAP